MDKGLSQVAGRFYPKDKGVPKTASGLYTKDNCHLNSGADLFTRQGENRERMPGRLNGVKFDGVKF